ncbi:DNA-binding transcriptional LysR family regulator [Rhizobium sp. BK529]|uniref:LysR family transcriptional regulator n=1 Tax=unclassified Rhizobium TaxID=2613769 RepID=UPI0010EC6633|nr:MULTISPECIES: LysR family transcriptional regulator [unclassified Rhizobium]MBB3590794.1 DNA-binding transcriptional LysR family regulator [Rhizobium sp. BK529]TCS09251.1 DNA-binding transcriptional LysR family regulator [Rhizobium sp. BK418]
MVGKEFTQIDWDDIRHFLALVQAGTFLGAARQIGVEHATVSRRITALEKTLGRKLVDRRGRRVILTADGEEVARHAASIAQQTAVIEQLGRTSATDMRGHVRISAPPALSSVLLAEPVTAIRRQHPGIEITLAGEKRLASLNRREADIAVRLSRPDDGDYAIAKIGQIAFHLYASKAYLDSVPEAQWTFIGYDEGMNASPQQLRLFELAAGRPIAIRSSVLEFQAAAARLGGGVVMLPDFAASEGLERIEDETPLTRDVWLVVHAEIRDVPAIRVVMEALKAAF